MVTEVMVRTDDVATGNGAEVDPAATVTLAGTVTPDLLVDSVTTSPPAGATPGSAPGECLSGPRPRGGR